MTKRKSDVEDMIELAAKNAVVDQYYSGGW